MILTIAIASALQLGGAAAHLTRAGPPVAPQAAGPLSFAGAQLGMTVAAWKALPPPPDAGRTATADCGPAVAAALREDGIDASAGGGATTCAYDARLGDDVLLHSARLGGRFRIDDLRYRFVGGRLAAVAFTASIDAYNDIDARLTRKYGAPTATVRDVLQTSAGRFPRVRETWRSAGGVVTLEDPTDDPLRLSVRIANPSAGG